jgi:DNA-binding transcriptional LysR family regulator
MRQIHPLEGLPVFLAVAELLSFNGAAKRLGISPSAASQAVRKLEQRIGMPLLRRSTRSISLTDTGTEYFERAAPALRDLLLATQEIAGRSGQVSGPLRLTMPRSAYDAIVASAMARFQAAHPAVTVEIDVQGRLVDLVEQGFDAGFRYGDMLARDVVAVRVLPASEAILAAAPGYLKRHAAPRCPADLLDHAAVMCRSQTTRQIRPWVIEADGKAVQTIPPVQTIVGDLMSQIDLMVRGLGIGLAATASISHLVDSGALTRVLPRWSTPLEPLCLYYPSRRNQSAALRAFIDFLHMPLPDPARSR